LRRAIILPFLSTTISHFVSPQDKRGSLETHGRPSQRRVESTDMQRHGHPGALAFECDLLNQALEILHSPCLYPSALFACSNLNFTGGVGRVPQSFDGLPSRDRPSPRNRPTIALLFSNPGPSHCPKAPGVISHRFGRVICSLGVTSRANAFQPFSWLFSHFPLASSKSSWFAA